MKYKVGDSIIIGGFHELPDGRIIRSFGWTGDKILYYFDDDSGRHEVSHKAYSTWKPREDLSDFPNARDPLLPYDFDLLWDIKSISQLKSALKNGHPDSHEILEMMDYYKIKIAGLKD
jgi:hypothetical protein